MSVRIGKKRARGVLGDTNPVIPGYKNIDVTSGSMNKLDGRFVKYDLSPMLIGPVTRGALRAELFENYWQYGKVFPDLGHLEDPDSPKDPWYTFRERGYAKTKADRHPEGTKSDEIAFTDDGNAARNHYAYYIPAFAVYDTGDGDVVYDYITARKDIYVPIYAELIRETVSFQKLKELVDAGQNIQILDIDGPQDGDVDNLKSHIVTVELLKTKINDPTAQFGHGYVVAALLAGIEPEEYV